MTELLTSRARPAGHEAGETYLSGIQALARVPLEVRRLDRRLGLRTAAFVSGYEGSPLGGYDLELGRHSAELAEHDIVFTPGVNEELAATAVQGAQFAALAPDRKFDGVTGYWYGKSPGLDRAADAVRHNNLMGTHELGGVLALVGDDAAAKSSSVPGASEFLLADLGLPTLAPADPQGLLDLGVHGVALSRACGLWAAMKIATNVADGRGIVGWSPDRVLPVEPDRVVDGARFSHRMTGRMLQPDLGRLERSRDGARLEIANRYAAANRLNRIEGAVRNARVGLAAAGKTYLDLRQALRELGLDDAELSRRGIRLLNLGMIHPLEPGIVREFARDLREIFVVEEKRPFVEAAVRSLLYGTPEAPAVSGKTDPAGRPLLPVDGELDSDKIARAVAKRLLSHENIPSVEAWSARAKAPRARIDLPLTTRTPYFCSGCPHNSSTQVPDGSVVGAGIGCHALVMVMDPDRVGEVTGLTQMGGEGVQWVGMAPFRERGHLFQNLGDGTFHHSGSLAVRAAVAAGVDITYKLLVNSAVAMTGGQQPTGGLGIPEIVRTLQAEGVARIILTTDEPKKYRRRKLGPGVRVWSRDRLTEAQEELSKVRGVTVLIHDQECATELRRKRKRGTAPRPRARVLINERVCEGCGDCGRKSNCLSVEPVATEFGRKTRIDQTSCNVDLSCLDGDCPAFVTVVPGPEPARAKESRPVLAEDALPEPVLRVPADEHTVRITGIGGTGVVTVAQILGAAAVLDGRQVRTLDQTGLAQKGGAVVSDLRTSVRPIVGTNKVSQGQCDLYLGCDLLVAADEGNLRAAGSDRTIAVVSTTQVPTGTMVTDPTHSFPDVGEVLGQLGPSVRDCNALDARSAAEHWLGDGQFANILLAGVAYQTGALPISAASIEAAIAANGVRADENIQAFRRGRQFVADPQGFSDHGRLRQPEPTAPGLAAVLSVRVPDLAAYQNKRYAARYEQKVAEIRVLEEDRLPGSDEITSEFARYLHKLMAYKDEYEVARLSLAPSLTDDVRARFGPGAKVSYRLHPPVLRALGMRRKLSLGPWFRPVFTVLAAARHVRGTPLDPFGYAALRRVERSLPDEYFQAVRRAVRTLTPENLALVSEIARLPDTVRGYESIKLAAVERYRERLAHLEDQLGRS